MPKPRKFKKVKKDKYLAQRRVRSPSFEKGQPEHLSHCRPRSRSSNEENDEDALSLPAFVSVEDRIPLPKTFRKAVDIVTDELLEAYKAGEEARLVMTFNQWHKDRQVYESIVYDCYKRLKEHGPNYVPVDETQTETYCYEFRAYLYALSLGYELKKNESMSEMKDTENHVDKREGKETERQKEKKKRKRLSLRGMLACVFPWAKCLRSMKVSSIQTDLDLSSSKESTTPSNGSRNPSLLSTSHSQVDNTSSPSIVSAGQCNVIPNTSTVSVGLSTVDQSSLEEAISTESLGLK